MKAERFFSGRSLENMGNKWDELGYIYIYMMYNLSYHYIIYVILYHLGSCFLFFDNNHLLWIRNGFMKVK